MFGLWAQGDPLTAAVTPLQGVILVLGAGCLGFVGQTLLNLSFQLENAGIAATMQYVEIVFAMIWGWALFGEGLPWQSAAGGGLVMACAVTTLLKKRKPKATTSTPDKP